MGSSKKVTVGYRYYIGLHFGLCHGPVDAVQKVVVGEREAWVGEQTASGSVAINAPKLFGGDKREGGVVGQLDVLMGESTQVENSYLQSKLGAAIPAFRGILSAVWRGGQVTANNPYLKPWAFRVKRILQGWDGGSAWYPEKAEVNGVTGEIIGTWQYETIPYHSNPGYEQLTPPGNWQGSTTLPLGFDSSIWPWPTPGGWSTPSLSICWVKQTITGNFTRLHISMRCDNGCLLFANGTFVGASNRNNVDIAGNDGNSYDFVISHSGVTEILVKAYSESLAGAQGGNFLDVVITPLSGDMNPAHMIYQCLTDTQWGMGYPTTAIDSASFTAAANALFAENFGLSMLWNQQETIDQFISIILDHIGGILYVRPDTSTFALRLIRSDYDRNTLPLYGPTTLVAAESYQRQAWGETVNEITVVYTDGATGKDMPATVQDLANISVQGGVVAQTRNYPGIRNASLAQRVALRDLQAGSTPLASIKLTATRAAWQVFPGDVFRLSWPEYQVDDVVYRALNVNRGTLTDGQIIIDAVEDVFGLPDNTYLVEQPGGWVDPSQPPSAAPYRKLLEAPYWDLARNLTAADLDYVDPLSGYIQTLAVRPSGDAINYEIYTKVSSAAYEAAGNGDFCPSATVVGALTKTTTAITLANGIDLDLVETGGYAIIDNEYVLVSAIDAGAGTATISRGLLDTVPTEHSAGARIWFADGDQGFSTTEYADGETVDVKLLPATGQGTLDISLAPVDSLTFDQRQYRPYAPGKLLLNSMAYPAWIDGDASQFSIGWAHRDRLAQTAYLVEQSESSIGPEAGTTYTLRIYGESDTLGREVSGLSGTSYTYDLSDELTDFPALGTEVLWTPASIITRAWYDFSDTGSVTVVSNAVSAIADKSGNGFTLSQGTAANRPAYTATINGLNVATFDGANDAIGAATAILGVTHSLFIVFKSTIEAATGCLFGQYASGATGRFAIMTNQISSGTTTSGRLNPYNASASNGAGYSGFLQDFAIANETTLFASISTTGSENYKAYKNGVVQDSGTVTALYTGANSNFGDLVAGSSASPYDGAICEVIAVASVVDAATRELLEGYLAHKWGFASNLDGGHPYKSEAPKILYLGSRLNGKLRVELESVRGGLTSHQHHNHSVLRDGYGYNYGLFYGGGA